MMTREVVEAGFVLALSAASGQAGGPLIQLIPFALVLGIFYFVVLLPMRRKQKKVEEFLSALKAGDRVITSGGLYGVITKVSDQSVQLQVAQNVRLEVARSAIVGYQGQAPIVEAANA
jgi:preprotein translocase subunit YajC